MEKEIKSISQIQPSFMRLEKELEQGIDKIVNERQLIIKDFLDAINRERQGTKYKPLTAKFVAVKLGHLSTFDLKFFFKQCYDSKSFGKVFFGALK